MCEMTSVGFMIDSLVVGFEVRKFVTQVFELLTHSLCPCFALALEAQELYVTKTDVVVEDIPCGHDVLLESCCMGRIAPQAQHAMLVEIPENQNDTISMSSSGGTTQ